MPIIANRLRSVSGAHGKIRPNLIKTKLNRISAMSAAVDHSAAVPGAFFQNKMYVNANQAM